MCCSGGLPALILKKEESQYYSCFRSFNVLFLPLLKVAQVTETGLRTEKSCDGNAILKVTYLRPQETFALKFLTLFTIRLSDPATH